MLSEMLFLRPPIVPVCWILESASSKSSAAFGPKRAHSSSSKTSHETKIPSSSRVFDVACHHSLASSSR
ncbi:unnamed protein product [Brassica oleracea]